MMSSSTFKDLIRQKGEEQYRDMPWREDTRPYFVLVSELMLQQTQVSRVIPKFTEFIGRFPDERALAKANLSDVLKQWQGLGYNRRAKYLHEAAKMIVDDFGGVFPKDQKDMQRLPGVGKNTAGAIAAYSFNQPSIFVETNIRTVFIHHFFADNFEVSDKVIFEKLDETLDRDNPREFYWALMDYGANLKAAGVRNINQSKHYKKQSPLKGSVREVRGRILRELSRAESLGDKNLRFLVVADERYESALEGLLRDHLIEVTAGKIHLTK